MNEDQSDKFTVGPAILGQCLYCSLFVTLDHYAFCRAFPGGVPTSILGNEFDHRLPHPDENEPVRFTPRPDVDPDVLAALEARLDELRAPSPLE